ncbi:MAG: VWA domain-containing protein [Acidobacteria bacterium]|nr:VWA domain-containing protein [Acidobacteriota bacterium]MCA1641387.1 VWA domain-containing protein [Acidobacteriota bacterium]
MKMAGGVMRKALALMLILLGAGVLFDPTRGAGAQTKTTARRKTTTARTSSTAVKPTPTPTTPVRVPQLPPATAAAANSQTTAQAARQTTPQPAQTPKPAPSPSPKPEDAIEDDEVYTVTSNLVVVPASVTDERGEPVLGLKAADFTLEEEGRSQTVAAVGDAEQVPLDIAILFDVSSSVSQKEFFAFQQRAAASFLKEVLKPTDRAAIVKITREPRLVQQLTSAGEATEKALAIPAATAAEPTAFYDTVSFAAKYLAENAPGRHRRVILAISDGDDNFSGAVREQTVAEYEAQQKAEAEGKQTPQGARAAARRDLQARHQRAVAAVQRDVQRADVVFYSINPGGTSVRLNDIASRAQNSMRLIAESTGGTAYLPNAGSELETVFRQIASELRAQYLLQYYSTNDAPAGKFLKIKVGVPARPALRVRARQGYYSKKG